MDICAIYPHNKQQNFRSLLSDMIANLQKHGEIRQDIPPIDITNVAFDMTLGAAQYLLMIPMEQREGYVETIFNMVEYLRPNPTQ